MAKIIIMFLILGSSLCAGIGMTKAQCDKEYGGAVSSIRVVSDLTDIKRYTYKEGDYYIVVMFWKGKCASIRVSHINRTPLTSSKIKKLIKKNIGTTQETKYTSFTKYHNSKGTATTSANLGSVTIDDNRMIGEISIKRAKVRSTRPKPVDKPQQPKEEKPKIKPYGRHYE